MICLCVRVCEREKLNIILKTWQTRFLPTDLVWIFDCGAWFRAPLWEGEITGVFFHLFNQPLPIYILRDLYSYFFAVVFTCRSKDSQRGLSTQKLALTTLSKLWRKRGKHCRISKRAMLCSLSQILLWNVLERHKRSCTCQTPTSGRYLNLWDPFKRQKIKCDIFFFIFFSKFDEWFLFLFCFFCFNWRRAKEQKPMWSITHHCLWSLG